MGPAPESAVENEVETSGYLGDLNKN